jgi:hypothetical protein
LQFTQRQRRDRVDAGLGLAGAEGDGAATLDQLDQDGAQGPCLLDRLRSAGRIVTSTRRRFRDPLEANQQTESIANGSRSLRGTQPFKVIAVGVETLQQGAGVVRSGMLAPEMLPVEGLAGGVRECGD